MTSLELSPESWAQPESSPGQESATGSMGTAGSRRASPPVPSLDNWVSRAGTGTCEGGLAPTLCDPRQPQQQGLGWDTVGPQVAVSRKFCVRPGALEPGTLHPRAAVGILGLPSGSGLWDP